MLASDHDALRAACTQGVGLCTITGIEGSFSRRLGAQLAVSPDGSVTGSLADGCLEKQLATEIASGGERRVMRFGAGSPLIDFRLPCGSGLDILVDPAPDHVACREVLAKLEAREEASLSLPLGPLAERHYVPSLRLVLFGEGPELDALALLGRSAGLEVETFSKDGSDGLSLGKAPGGVSVDRWTGVVLLFHDHEWEQAILQWALQTPAFFIGAQGGRSAREERAERLLAAGVNEDALARVASPIGVVQHSREPMALALSILASVVGEYEAIHPHHGVSRG
ncbi:XdhC family protein [Alteraurantiacibacter aquimixticola]|uniref:XdhC family protein n=1 Tax=Alteraurantiacibacter aquimixticola TaxID=2489173 RepID=A0A4T3F0S9_9SPHN|nr:XdhC family protein [Alteraurantiacibacter aquimixticola]TIX50659.1 XdhC family protein [Alteraurantiacibacter aquimixticola]